MRTQPEKKILYDNSGRSSGLHKAKGTLPADSPEILYQHYCDKIVYLQTALNKLNLLEHPREIQSVCSDIMRLKKKSAALLLKHKIKRSTYF